MISPGWGVRRDLRLFNRVRFRKPASLPRLRHVGGAQAVSARRHVIVPLTGSFTACFVHPERGPDSGVKPKGLYFMQNAQNLSYTTAAEIGQCPAAFNGLQLSDGYACLLFVSIVLIVFVVGMLAYSAGQGDKSDKELRREREARPQKDADALMVERREFFESISQDVSFMPDMIADRMKAWDAEKFTA